MKVANITTTPIARSALRKPTAEEVVGGSTVCSQQSRQPCSLARCVAGVAARSINVMTAGANESRAHACSQTRRAAGRAAHYDIAMAIHICTFTAVFGIYASMLDAHTILGAVDVLLRPAAAA